MAQAKPQQKQESDTQKKASSRDRLEELSPVSKELVIGLIGYAGAGCSHIGQKLEILLSDAGYEVHYIKLSGLIDASANEGTTPRVEQGKNEGRSKLERACALQDSGDELRENHGHDAVAVLSVKEIIQKRGARERGKEKLAFILDSIKHDQEVHLLRRVYDQSFRLVAIHCERSIRESRLIGTGLENVKYRGADPNQVTQYMDRDEKDSDHVAGQQVRDAFYIADYFLDNNLIKSESVILNADIQRFMDLLLSRNVVRPRRAEVGMFHAHAAALQSACLSRQVGAALQNKEGQIVSTGTNEAPKFGGGVYSEDSQPDNRCFAWKFNDTTGTFVGCHNTRQKKLLRDKIASWLAEQLTDRLAEAAHPIPQSGLDTAQTARIKAKEGIRTIFLDDQKIFDGLPGIGDLIEYSRSIHAEMSALINAARQGSSPDGCVLFCTTFPCHNCARHLITAGIREVYYIEPYVKSLANILHSDAIQTERDPASHSSRSSKKTDRMIIVPFTGVGPRMYEDYFTKLPNIKNDQTGDFRSPNKMLPKHAVRIRDLGKVEEAAAGLIPNGISTP